MQKCLYCKFYDVELDVCAVGKCEYRIAKRNNGTRETNIRRSRIIIKDILGNNIMEDDV